MNRNLSYRLDKIRFRWMPQIQYDLGSIEEEESESEEEKSDEPSEEFISQQDLISIKYELNKIKKRSKRQLEIYIKVNKERINDLEDGDREELMGFIQERYYSNLRK